MRDSSPRGYVPVALLVILAWPVASDAAYQLVDLGRIASSDPLTINAMNASGDAVGTLSPILGSSSAISWTDGRSVTPSAMPSYARSSTGAGINSRGDTTGTFVDARDNKAHAYRISEGKFQDLGSLPGASTGGTAISDGGDVAGTASFPGGFHRAFRSINGGGFETIDPLAGGASNRATGINSLGTVIGDSDIGYNITRAFVAFAGEPAIDLLALHPGSPFSGSTHATAINDQGMIVGHGDFGSGSHAFLATRSGPLIDLGVTGLARSSYAYGLNDRMQVVGALDMGGGLLRAFSWDPSSGMVDLNTVLSPTDQKSWVLSKAMAIDATGRIVGLGYRDGELHGFLLQPIQAVPAIVPAPPAWALTAIGGMIAGGWARLRRGRTPGRASA